MLPQDVPPDRTGGPLISQSTDEMSYRMAMGSCGPRSVKSQNDDGVLWRVGRVALAVGDRLLHGGEEMEHIRRAVPGVPTELVTRNYSVNFTRKIGIVHWRWYQGL